MSGPESPMDGVRRRRFAINLWVLMLVVLIAGCWLGAKVNRAHTQGRAVGRIKTAGGFVAYDYQFDGRGAFIPNAAPRGPAWLRERIGDEFFQEVTEVAFFGDKATDDDFAAIEDLDGLRSVGLTATARVTDAGLSHLRRLKRLRSVTIRAPSITDAGLANLASLAGLRELDLVDMPVTDRGLLHIKANVELETLRLSGAQQLTDRSLVALRGLTRLRALHLSNTKITGDGLSNLARLTELRELDLGYTPITDKSLEFIKANAKLVKLRLEGTRRITDRGLAMLRELKNLRSLNLSGTKITDDGLQDLARLTGLRELNLSMDLVSDAGLARLTGLRQLRELKVIGTQVTDKGVTTLTAAIPKVAVLDGSPGPHSFVPLNAYVISLFMGDDPAK